MNLCLTYTEKNYFHVLLNTHYSYAEAEEGHNWDQQETESPSLSSAVVTSMPVVEIIGDPDSLHLKARLPHEFYDGILTREVSNSESKEKR